MSWEEEFEKEFVHNFAGQDFIDDKNFDVARRLKDFIRKVRAEAIKETESKYIKLLKYIRPKQKGIE